MQRVGLYVRVSTQEQADKGWSIDAQYAELRKFCDSHKDWKVVRAFNDPGYTAANLDRPGIRNLLECAQRGDLDVLVVWRYDRLSRDNLDFPLLLHLLKKSNVHVVSATEPSADDGSPHGEFVVGLLGLLATLERRTNAVRVKLGMRARAKKGLWHGGTPAYGYRYDSASGRLDTDPEAAATVSLIFLRYSKLGNLHSLRTQLASQGTVGWSGNAHISYYDVGNKDLKYAKWDGRIWNKATVDSVSDVGMYTSLELNASGHGRISYYNETSTALKYAKWSGSAWNTETVDSTGDVGLYTSLELDASGYGRISYYDATNKNLRYASWDGSIWSPGNVESTGDVGMFTSLDLDGSGYPRISYYDETNGNLKYAIRNGGGVWTPETVDSIGDANREVLVAGQKYTGNDAQGYLLVNTWGYGDSNMGDETTWTTGQETVAHSVYAADVDDDEVDEILTAGYNRTSGAAYRWAQLRMWSYWDGFVPEAEYWWKGQGPTDSAEAYSIHVSNLDSDDVKDIMTCGYRETASGDEGQIRVYHIESGSFALKGSENWIDGSGSRGVSVHAGDVDDDGESEIITGGWSVISGRTYAEIKLWRFDLANLTIKWLATKQWRDFTSSLMSNYTDAKANSVFALNVDSDSLVEIVSGGQVRDATTPWYAQLRIWYDP